MEEIISHIVEDWFLTEPILFAAYCTHSLEENTRMTVPMRTGKMRIEYNPDILTGWSKAKIEERLKYEVIRILLGHPYQRQPYKATKGTLGIASDVTLRSVYSGISTIRLPEGLDFEKGLCFEEYYSLVQKWMENFWSPPSDREGQINDGGGGATDDADSKGDPTQMPPDGNGEKKENDPEGIVQFVEQEAESAELWEEDQLAAEQVKDVVRKAQKTRQWGSIGGGLKGEIEATTIVKLDYRTILSWFRATVLSSNRHLTRMHPSRRYGFQFMGSKRDFSTRILVAIDVSNSVIDEQVSQAISIINRFFKYGIETIDVVQFDVDLKGDPIPMKKAAKTMEIKGRGGTDFQAPIDYFLEHKYDGLIMITDGCAPEPKLPKHFYGNILWMIYELASFGSLDLDINPEMSWIANLPKSKYLILPPV